MARSRTNTVRRKRTSNSSSSPRSGDRKKRRSTSNEKNKCPKKEIIKSPKDAFQYKLIILTNGIKAILVSMERSKAEITEYKPPVLDKDSGELQSIVDFNKKHVEFCPANSQTENDEDDNSNFVESSKRCSKEDDKTNSFALKLKFGYGALSLTVGAGSCDNPNDLQGLAHLCEHCVCLSTRKSGEAWFENVRLNNGTINAYTDLTRTVYYFAMPLTNANGNNTFDKASELLSQAIADPLIANKPIVNEINSVDCEYQMRSSSESFGLKFYTVLLSLAKSGHPLNTFTCGNQESLGKKCIGERLRQWKKEHYVGDSITLAIQAELSLDELEKIVVNNFSRIPAGSKALRRSSKLTRNDDDPFDTPKFRKMYNIATTNPNNWLMISWSLPSEVIERYQVSPLKYISYVLNYENEGSITEYLKTKLWASAFTSFYLELGYCVTFHIFVNLTSTGLDNYQSVIEAIFSYLNFIKFQETDKRIFNELQQVLLDEFHYAGDSQIQILRNVVTLNNEIHNRRGIHALTSNNLITRFDPDFVDSTVKKLIPSAANFMIISRRCKWMPSSGLKRQELYGTKYFSNCLPELALKTWENVRPFPEYRLRPRNYALLLRDFHCPPASKSKTLLSDKRATVIYLAKNYCIPGELPTGKFCIGICSNLARSPLNTALKRLWMSILESEIQSDLDGIGSTFGVKPSCCCSGICFQAYCPSVELFHTSMTFLTKFDKLEEELKESMFEMYRRTLLNSWGNYDSIAHLVDTLQFILSPYHSNVELLHNLLSDACYKDFLDFIYGFKGQLQIVGAIVGNLRLSQPEKLADYIRRLPCRKIPGGLQSDMRANVLQLPLGQKYLRLLSPNREYSMSGILNYYQIGPISWESTMTLYMISEIMNVAAFTQLRTIQQLSYSVYAFLNSRSDVIGLTVILLFQAQKHTGQKIDKHIDDFLRDFFNTQLCKENLNEFKKHPGFKHITETSWEEIRQMYRDYFLPEGKSYRKLSIQIEGNEDPKKKEHEKVTKPKSGTNEAASPFRLIYNAPAKNSKISDDFIRSVNHFKSTLFTYPALSSD